MKPHEVDTPVSARVAILDPESIAVLWTNDSEAGPNPALEAVFPLASTVGLLDAVREVAEKAKPLTLRTDLVSTTKGAVAVVMAAYPLPDGNVLVLAENAWQPSHKRRDEPGGVRPHRGRR